MKKKKIIILNIITTLVLIAATVAWMITYNSQGIERVYEGTKNVWSEDTLQYQQMGPGCYWSFFDIAGEEVIWMLEGGKVSINEYIIQMQGTSTPELMEIIITEAVTKE